LRLLLRRDERVSQQRKHQSQKPDDHQQLAHIDLLSIGAAA